MLPGPSCWPILNQSPQQWRSTAWSQLAPISSASVLLMMWERDSLARRQTGELKTLFISHINILKAFLSLSAHHLIGSSSEKPKQCQKTRVKTGLCWLLVNSTLCIWDLFPRQPDWLIPSVKSREKRDIHVSLPRRIHIQTCAIACKHAFSNTQTPTDSESHREDLGLRRDRCWLLCGLTQLQALIVLPIPSCLHSFPPPVCHAASCWELPSHRRAIGSFICVSRGVQHRTLHETIWDS